MIQLIITTMLYAMSGTTLCCHSHDDGFYGCWPAKAGECPSGTITKNCRAGATQADENDEESWYCDGAATS